MNKTIASRTRGVSLLPVALLFAVFFVAARFVLKSSPLPDWLRVTVALAPVPAFVLMVLGLRRATGKLDELQRLIQLEALAFGFSASWVLLLTLGLLEIAIELPSQDLSYRHVWALMPIFYFLGVWIAQRKYGEGGRS